MGIKANDMIIKLMGMGVMATVNQTIDYDTAELVAVEFGFEVERAAFEEETILSTSTGRGSLTARDPVPCRDHHGPCRPRQDIAA
jgi:translation initiation factor IF-2